MSASSFHRPAPAPPSRRRLLIAASAGLAGTACGGGGGGGAMAAAPQGAASAPPAAGSIATVTSWASRPDAATAVGQAILVTDVGVNGSIWYSSGLRWVQLAAPLTLAHRYSNAQMDGSIGAGSDAYLDACTIPAYVLGPASCLRVTAAWSFPGNGVGGKAPQIKAWFGSGSYASGFVSLLDARGQLATQRSLLVEAEVQNRNAMALNQVRPNDYVGGASANAFAESAIDFSQAVTIGFGAVNDSAGANPNDQQRLDWFSVELVA